MGQPCEFSGDIKRIKTLLDGNGKEGLVIQVDRLQQKQDDMNQTMESLAESYTKLAEAKIEERAVSRAKIKEAEHRSNSIKTVGVFASIVFGLLGGLFLFLNYFK